MRLRLIYVGGDRSGLFEPAAREYASRLEHYVRFDEVAVPASRRREVGRAAREEGEAILAEVRDKEDLIALDEHGTPMSSRELAQWLGRALASGRGLAFAVGGDEGLSEAVRRRAKVVLSLSRMTLPHRLARVVLLEQIYRAFSILRGEPYHR